MKDKTPQTHTPGPLTLKQITDGTPDCACKFVPGHLNLQRCSLHAAAPELLAALRLVASNECNMSGCDRITQGAIRAAIAHAEGR